MWRPDPHGSADCKTGILTIHFSCLQVRFVCKQYGNVYSLEQLAHRISNKQFEKIEELVSDRLSDRL